MTTIECDGTYLKRKNTSRSTLKRIDMLVRQRMGDVQRTDQLHCDRTQWEKGPWDHEGFDNFAWYDFDTGYTCQMVRNHSGAWCGYVSVPDDHPLRHVEYNDDGMPDLDVHGGITFSDEGWFGFDCNHAFDDDPLLGGTQYFTASDVIEEVTRLAAQLKVLSDARRYNAFLDAEIDGLIEMGQDEEAQALQALRKVEA